MPKIGHPKDFYSGLLFAVIGLGAIVWSGEYQRGSAARMGPGYFPFMLGIMLMVLGLVLALRALKIKGSAMPSWQWRPMVIVLGSVVLFGAIVTKAGLALSTVLLILIASAASREYRWRESILSSVILAAVAVGIFVVGLKLQLPIWPWSN